MMLRYGTKRVWCFKCSGSAVWMGKRMVTIGSKQIKDSPLVSQLGFHGCEFECWASVASEQTGLVSDVLVGLP